MPGFDHRISRVDFVPLPDAPVMLWTTTPWNDELAPPPLVPQLCKKSVTKSRIGTTVLPFLTGQVGDGNTKMQESRIAICHKHSELIPVDLTRHSKLGSVV
jgi:hypothetical protein